MRNDMLRDVESYRVRDVIFIVPVLFSSVFEGSYKRNKKSFNNILSKDER